MEGLLLLFELVALVLLVRNICKAEASADPDTFAGLFAYKVTKAEKNVDVKKARPNA